MTEKTAEELWQEMDQEERGASAPSPEPALVQEQDTAPPAVEPPERDPFLSELMDKVSGLEAQLAQTTTRLRNAEGHIGGLNKQVKAARATTEAQGHQAPTAAEITAARTDPESMAALKRDYPEFAEAMSAALKAELEEFKKQIPQQQQPTEPAVTAEDLQTLKNDMFVEVHHAGWKNVVRTAEFAGWLGRQPGEVQMLASSAEPDHAVRLLDLYKARQKAQVSDAGLSSAAALPSGKSGTRVSQKSVDDMTPDEYWRYLDEQDRMQR